MMKWPVYQQSAGAARQERYRQRHPVTPDVTAEGETEKEGETTIPPAALPMIDELALKLGTMWVSTGHPMRLKGKAIECAREALADKIQFSEIEQAYTVAPKRGTPWEAIKAIDHAHGQIKPHVVIANAEREKKRIEEAEKLRREIKEQAGREKDPEYVRMREESFAKVQAALRRVGLEKKE